MAKRQTRRDEILGKLNMETYPENLAAADQILDQMAEKICWSVIAGSGTGSMAILAFGSKIERAKPLSNTTLSSDQRRFNGEFSIFIKHAIWELSDGDEHTICNCYDSNEPGGLMVPGLNRLVGNELFSRCLDEKTGNLLLNFSNGLSLHLTCDGGEPGWHAYTLNRSDKTEQIVYCKNA